MAYKAAVIIFTVLCAQTLCAPQVNKKAVLRPPANLSYEELEFILNTRIGGTEPARKPTTLSPCTRAILGCCKEGDINESCSENLGCGAFFFDVNPCDDAFIRDALKEAKQFYQQLEKTNESTGSISSV